jgi:hypothetical protein
MTQKRGFFARLFGLGRRRDSFQLSVGSVLAVLMGRAIRGIPDVEEAAHERIDPETLLAEIGRAGWRAAYFREVDPPDLILYFPAGTLAAFSGNAGGIHGGFPAQLGEATETIAAFLAARPPADGSKAGDAAIFHHRFLKKYSMEDSEEIAWRASGCACYRIAVGDAPVYACVERSVEMRTENAFESDDAFAESVRSMAAPGEKPRAHPKEPGAPGGDRSRRVELLAPREFSVGNLFLPPRIPCGKYLVETRFRAAEVPADRGAFAADGTWAHTSCTVAGKKWPLWYLFPSGTAETVKGIAGCALRESLGEISSVLGARAEGPGIAMGSRPDPEVSQYIVLEASLSVGPARFSCSVFVGNALVSLLAKTLLHPSETSLVSRGPAAALPVLFAVNTALFSKRVGTFHRAFLDAGAEGRFSFGAFLDLIPELDRAIVLQNYVLRSLGPRGLRSLFSYSESVQAADGKTQTRVLTPYAIDEERLLSCLPQRAREDWTAPARAAPDSAAEHDRLTVEMLDGISRSIGGKSLLLSPRTVLVLERFFLPEHRARAKKILERISADGVPYAAVRRLPKAQIQQFFGTQANRAIALSIMGSEKDLPFVRENVSKKRAAGLAEDIAFIARLHGEGSIGIGEILEAKQEMERAAGRMLEELARQAARAQARRPPAIKSGGVPPPGLGAARAQARDRAGKTGHRHRQ